jgi:hypothetical protein
LYDVAENEFFLHIRLTILYLAVTKGCFRKMKQPLVKMKRSNAIGIRTNEESNID